MIAPKAGYQEIRDVKPVKIKGLKQLTFKLCMLLYLGAESSSGLSHFAGQHGCSGKLNNTEFVFDELVMQNGPGNVELGAYQATSTIGGCVAKQYSVNTFRYYQTYKTEK